MILTAMLVELAAVEYFLE